MCVCGSGGAEKGRESEARSTHRCGLQLSTEQGDHRNDAKDQRLEKNLEKKSHNFLVIQYRYSCAPEQTSQFPEQRE